MTTAPTFSDARTLAASTSCRTASFARFGIGEPQRIEQDGSRTWIARGANFVVAATQVREGSEILQDGLTSESMVLAPPALPLTISAGAVTERIDEEALVILPPGSARLKSYGAGTIVRIFSSDAHDWAKLAGNAPDYARPVRDVAPATRWPDPADGYSLRVYRLREHSEDVGFGRIFRSTNLMVNIFEPSQAPRDLARLSPHEHADFEQGSLTLAGEFVHYLRTPWGADSTLWRPDRTVQCSGLSLIVIPPKMIHTTSWAGPGARLVDIFAPPREDFSSKPRWVRNAEDYPMPPPTDSPGKTPRDVAPPAADASARRIRP